MDFVTTLDLSDRAAFAQLPDTLTRSDRGWHGSGVAITQPFTARLAYGFAGVSPYPIAAGAQVAVGRDGVPHRWHGGTWQPAEAPEFYSLDELRDRLGTWLGTIQFWIDFGPQTLIDEIAVAYSLPNYDLASYLREFALPALVRSKPIELVRDVQPRADGSIALPQGLTADRIASAAFLAPERSLHLVIPAIVDGDRLQTQPIAPATPGKLILKYRVTARGTDDDFDQIDDLPQVLFREVRRDRPRYPLLHGGATAQVTAAMARRQVIEAIADSLFEVQVLAARSDEARSIAASLRSIIAFTPMIDCPPYGTSVPILLDGGVNFTGSTRAIGDLDRASFRVRALHLAQSVQGLNVPIIDRIEMWWQGIELGDRTGQVYPESWVR